MSVELRKKPPAASLARRHRLEISVLARNRALHYLANHPLTEDERAQLTEVVHGYTGPCDVVAAREGLAWLRERYRAVGDADSRVGSRQVRLGAGAHLHAPGA